MTVARGQGIVVPEGDLQRCSPASEECSAGRHGTINAYKNHGCRCPIARRAWSRYMKDYRLRRLEQRPAFIDATGTCRRIRALQAIGWTGADLGVRLDCTATAVLLLAKRSKVRRDTAARVRSVYNALADKRGPSRYTETLAATRGWLPPIWWDDDLIDDPGYDPLQLNLSMIEISDHGKSGPKDFSDGIIHEQIVDPIAVERACSNDPDQRLPRLNDAERTVALQQLLAAGHNKTEAARRLKLSGKTVNELLAFLPSTPGSVGVTGDPAPVAEAEGAA